jgi:hypothetical protein
LPTICRERKEYVPKIADVLAQLLQTEDPIELNIVNQSLTTLAKYDAKGFFGGLFSQIITGEDFVRERAVKFLKDRFKLIPSDIFTKEIEDYFLTECQKVMTDVTKDEFVTFMTLLSGLKVSKSLTGQQLLLDIVKEQAELNNPFDVCLNTILNYFLNIDFKLFLLKPSEVEFLDKLLMCIRHAIPFFSVFIFYLIPFKSIDFSIYTKTDK